MKKYEFSKSNYSRVNVICKNDGEIAYCNCLAVNGLCKCDDYLCPCAVAAICETDHEVKVISYPEKESKIEIQTTKKYIALED